MLKIKPNWTVAQTNGYSFLQKRKSELFMSIVTMDTNNNSCIGNFVSQYTFVSLFWFFSVELIILHCSCRQFCLFSGMVSSNLDTRNVLLVDNVITFKTLMYWLHFEIYWRFINGIALQRILTASLQIYSNCVDWNLNLWRKQYWKPSYATGKGLNCWFWLFLWDYDYSKSCQMVIFSCILIGLRPQQTETGFCNF